ncbi:NAD kinase-like isoform X2 [Xyrichtys novacula]|uniref:NAD kinase-like isoform X2 n=1 Tax=Xyrichtys novacula TaxID=13765 RepID=A0AAV1GA96_XYRNO|nr:NAD kinase-like isoform X2 [Xyrichtys novacula]
MPEAYTSVLLASPRGNSPSWPPMGGCLPGQARKAQRHDRHILHYTTTIAAPPSRLKSNHPYNKAAQEMLNSTSEDISRDDPGGGAIGGDNLPCWQWSTLNRLRTGVGRFKTSMKKSGLVDSAAYECGDPEWTADHTISTYPLYRPPSEA